MVAMGRDRGLEVNISHYAYDQPYAYVRMCVCVWVCGCDIHVVLNFRFHVFR